MEEEEILNTDEAITEVSYIDAQIMEIRNNPEKKPNEKLQEITDLMEHRNLLVDQLQRAKETEFREFVEKLDLHGIGCQPFFPVGRKCRISTNNPDAELVEKPPEFEKSFFGIVKKPKKDTNMITMQNYEMFENRLKEVENRLEIYKDKKILSPQDKAKKLRLEAEIEEIKKFLEN